jgi:hypothetical protein
MTDDIINAAKEAAYNFHRRLGDLGTAMQLRKFVDDYFHSLNRKEFWWNVASFYELDGVAPFSDDLGSELKVLFTKEAFLEWSTEKACYKDERALLGFKLGDIEKR